MSTPLAPNDLRLSGGGGFLHGTAHGFTRPLEPLVRRQHQGSHCSRSTAVAASCAAGRHETSGAGHRHQPEGRASCTRAGGRRVSLRAMPTLPRLAQGLK